VKRFLIAATLAAVALLVVLSVMPPDRTPTAPWSLTIAAASDLRYAFDDVAMEFRRQYPSTDVTVTYGSSGTFFAQLQNGAPFDVFLSADISYPRQLAQKGLVLAGSEFKYAEGRIVVWVPKSSQLDVEARGLSALTDFAVNKVAIANPAHAPYGRAAEAAMRSTGVFNVVKPKLVFGENVSQALQFVQSGAADAGIVALSLVRAPALADTGRYWEIPVEAHPAIEQGGAIMRSAANSDAALVFRAFMLGDSARAILRRYGFATPVV
jgi:molybdate transport system substrate-binding protein